eukprot:9346999-Pyramimonas_sp.AAC.1
MAVLTGKAYDGLRRGKGKRITEKDSAGNYNHRLSPSTTESTFKVSGGSTGVGSRRTRRRTP